MTQKLLSKNLFFSFLKLFSSLSHLPPLAPPRTAVMCCTNTISLKAGKWFAEILNIILVVKKSLCLAHLYHLHLVKQLNFRVLSTQ